MLFFCIVGDGGTVFILHTSQLVLQSLLSFTLAFCRSLICSQVLLQDTLTFFFRMMPGFCCVALVTLGTFCLMLTFYLTQLLSVLLMLSTHQFRLPKQLLHLSLHSGKLLLKFLLLLYWPHRQRLRPQQLVEPMLHVGVIKSGGCWSG